MTLPKLPTFGILLDSPSRGELPDVQNASGSGAKLKRVCRLCRKRRRGAAAVEFAFVAPVFFMLVLGMLEFGRMVMVQQVITNGSREGARVAVLDGTTGAEVVAAVQDYMSAANVSGVNVTVDPTEPTSAGYGDPVTVTVSVPFSEVSWLPSPFMIGGDTNLTAATVMRRETIQ
ncbi:MAG: pilus assembly protein [Candidatus Nealsonbacteria bacterium]|nr:pilus assembly protein [Candidatus Nealsonbacteria bacterium]